MSEKPNPELVKEKAKKLLDFFGADGKHWTMGTLARNKSGYPVNVLHPTADRWCLMGACKNLDMDSFWLEDVIKDSTGQSVPSFNDESHSAHVVFDEIISSNWPRVRDFLSHLVHTGKARQE